LHSSIKIELTGIEPIFNAYQAFILAH